MNSTWINTLYSLIETEQTSNPRGMLIKELLNYHTSVDMSNPILTINERKLGYRFMVREAWWIMSGCNDVESIKDYSKAISNFSDDGFYFKGAYGPRVVDQLHYVVDSLVSDINTRQAVLTIWRANPRVSKDIPCTVSIQWFIRNNTIYCIDNMRSSDIWLGWPYDIFNFSMLTGYLILLLRERGVDNLELGEIYLNAGSQHLYENNFEKAESLLKNYTVFENKNLFNPYEFGSPIEFKNYLKAISEKDIKALNNYKSIFLRDILKI